MKLVVNVKTVPAWDMCGMCNHTAYTVYAVKDNILTFCSGWTLKDAIESYANIYNLHRDSIVVQRPFKKQHTQEFPLPPL